MENRPAGAGGGGGKNARSRKSKNKRSRKRDNSRRNAGGSAGNKGGSNKGGGRNKGPPSPPQTKVVIRNIGDVTKHGTVKDVVEIIRSMIDGANQKLSALTSRIIQLDEPSVECLIQEEEAILNAEAEEAKRKEEAAKRQPESTEQHDNETTEENGEEEKEAEEEFGDVTNETLSSKFQPEKSDQSVQDANSTTEGSTTNLGARVVYIVPPKKTRRRGIKPGCAYLVISGPTIEAKDPVATLTTEPSPSDPAKEEKKDSAEEEVEVDATENEADNNKTNEVAPPPEDAENHVVIVEPPSDPTPSVPIVDYSREVARGRFLVIQAIDVMEAHAQDDAKADLKYAGSMVELAMSGKTYKNQFLRRDRREGTLETTADYKTFVENAAKVKEELMARPKPAPGGGATQAITTTSTDGVEDGQPLAALVEHIRSKRAEASKRKKAKKKAKDSANKEKGGGGGKASRKKKGKEGTKEEGGRKGGRKKDGKKRKSGKKKNGKGGTNSAMQPAAPTAVLKPGGAVAAGMGAPTSVAQPSASLPGINGVMGGGQGYG